MNFSKSFKEWVTPLVETWGGKSLITTTSHKLTCGSKAGHPELLWETELDQGSEPDPKEVVKLVEVEEPTSDPLEVSAFGFQGSDPESRISFSVKPGFHWFNRDRWPSFSWIPPSWVPVGRSSAGKHMSKLTMIGWMDKRQKRESSSTTCNLTSDCVEHNWNGLVYYLQSST